MKKYDPRTLEPKWQKTWEDTKLYAATDFDARPKYVMLTEFPYPSGDGLHMGHVREYTLGDILARYKRGRGHNVLYPMGYDAFGLPTENYAIKTKVTPQAATATNVATFRKQFDSLGYSIDWDRSVNTTDPSYYRWTQWLFLQFYKHGLAYQDEIAINWCPFCKTGLANEEVVNGRHERCGTLVEKKQLKQWLLRITDYADRLIDGLKDLDYPSRIADQQVNWIGRSVGAEISFTVGSEAISPPVDSLKFWEKHAAALLNGKKTSTIRLEPKQLKVGDVAEMKIRIDEHTVKPFGYATIRAVERKPLDEISLQAPGHEPYASSEEMLADYRNYYGEDIEPTTEFTIYHFEKMTPSITVFTTRADTLYGVTYLVLAPEHELVDAITTEEQRGAVHSYVKAAQAKSEIERMDTERTKTGAFTGAYAINPATGKPIPIWVADYVLMGYGTGAIMAVPAHDQRDHEFARKFDLPIVEVVEPVFGAPQGDEAKKEAIIAVVRNPKTNQYIVLDWGPRQDRWGGSLFVGGGLDEGEDPVECAQREIAEETGYTNVKLVSQTETVGHNYFYSNVKNKNYYARCKGLLFDLVDDTQVEQSLDEGEKQKFKVTWADATTVERTVNAEHLYVYTRLVKDNVYAGEGLMINSGVYVGLSSSEVRERATKEFGQERVNYKLRDWIFSRQHYWGEPIPIIHCEEHGAVAVPDDQLPVELPVVDNYEPTDTGESPLAQMSDWVNTVCPTCGKPAKRETDTMPNWAGSSWYYLRYFDAHNDAAFAERKKLDYWGQVDMYLGGMEHTTLHLLYSRFWHQFFYDQGLVPTPEPYAARRGQGIVLAADGTKMSKSKGNVVNPSDYIEKGYGADALRLTLAFLAPYDQTTPWNPNGIDGTKRFLNRVWALVQDHLEVADSTAKQTVPDLPKTIHKTIKKVTVDLESFGFNTAIAAMMEAVNELYKLKAEHGLGAATWRANLKLLIQILAPFAPHLTEELWRDLGGEGSVHVASWPAWDKALVKDDTVTLIVQVNGRLRAQLGVVADISEDDAVRQARRDENIQKYLGQGELVKTIFVPGKLINFVVK